MYDINILKIKTSITKIKKNREQGVNAEQKIK